MAWLTWHLPEAAGSADHPTQRLSSRSDAELAAGELPRDSAGAECQHLQAPESGWADRITFSVCIGVRHPDPRCCFAPGARAFLVPDREIELP